MDRERRDYSKRTPVRIRASSIGELFDCAARWEAKNVRHLRTPQNGGAQLGKALHASTAAFDESLVKGAGLTADDAAGALVDAIYKPAEKVTWDEDMGQPEAESIGLALHRLYCTQLAPQQHYKAVEVKCESLIITDLALELTGTTDRVRHVTQPDGRQGHGISDLKSGKTAVRADGHVETAGHALQLGVYELIAEHATQMPITEPARIVGLQVAKTSKGQRVASADTPSPREILVGDGDTPGALEHAAAIIHSGLFPGNPRSMLCGVRYCPVFDRCRWRR